MKNRFLNWLNPEVITQISPALHTHEWELVSKTYATPVHGQNLTTLTDQASMDKALFGVTSLLWQCPACHESKKEEMLGSDADTLDDLLNKVDLKGPQYLDRGADTYMIGKVPPETSIPLPVR